MKGAGRYSFGAHLALFALLVSLPLTILAGFLFVHSTNVVREQAEARLMQLAEAASENLDRDAERHILVLNTLSTLPSFRAGDWQRFYAQAQTALRGEGYIVVTAGDPPFRQLMNTFVPYGEAPDRTGDMETAQRIRASRRAEVSSAFTSLVTRGRVFNIDIPILRNGEVEYILMYGRPVEHLITILEGQSLEANWTSTVFDRHGVVIASSEQAAADASGEAIVLRVGTSSLSRYTDAAGNTILRATHTSALTGWTTAVDVPLAVVSAEINRTLQWLVLSAAGALLLAIGVAVLFGHFLSRQLRRAADYARASGREERAPELGPTTLVEIGAIAEALQNARAELGRRIEQQRLLSRELNHRVKNLLSVTQAVVRMTLSGHGEAGKAKLIMERLQALGRSQDLLTRSDWTELPLRQIIEAEIASFADRVRCEGPDVTVRSTNVQNFGLIVHELVTNAVKYGALRDDVGAITLSWSVEEEGAGKRFKFRWKERCTPGAGGAQKAGFGSTILKKAFAAPDAKHRFEVEPDGLVYELDVALGSVVTGDAAAVRPDAEEERAALSSPLD